MRAGIIVSSLKVEISPVEVGITDGLGKGVGKDADVDTTETADGLSAQITVVHASKMGEVLAIDGVV